VSHTKPKVLAAYVADPRGIPNDDVEHIEEHLISCDRCRSQVAQCTASTDLERSWTAIERELQTGWAARTWSPDRHDRATRAQHGTAGIGPQRRIVLGFAAALLVVAVAGLVWVSASRPETPSSAPLTLGWEVGGRDGGETLTTAGEILGISALLEWRSGLVVVGAVQTPDGQRDVAWTTTGDGGWSEHILTFPDGCDQWGGLGVRGDELLVGCVRADASTPVVAVASTRDLDAWTVHDVGPISSSFGVIMGTDGRRVSVAALEADDPNTTEGARLRVWTSEDLVTWEQRPGVDDSALVDAVAQRIRMFGDDIVIVGAVNTWPDGSSGPVAPIASVWISHDGRPFVVRSLTDEFGHPSTGYVHDITETDQGFVAVGGDGGQARAWVTTDLDSWAPAVVVDPEPVGPSGPGAMWSVATDGGRLVAGSIGDPGVATATWLSLDEGYTWQPLGNGPSVLLSHDGSVIGVRADAPVGPWQLGPP
jgi:hypothetical protein